jgi:hypothetical protein
VGRADTDCRRPRNLSAGPPEMPVTVAEVGQLVNDWAQAFLLTHCDRTRSARPTPGTAPGRAAGSRRDPCVSRWLTQKASTPGLGAGAAAPVACHRSSTSRTMPSESPTDGRTEGSDGSEESATMQRTSSRPSVVRTVMRS